MNLDRVAAFKLSPVVQSYDAKDSMLYALGLGYGSDPTNRADLRFVFEQGKTPLLAVPSMCVVLAHPGFWLRNASLGIDVSKLVHAEQRFEIHRPLAAEGRVRAEYSIACVEDKGREKGALLHQTKTLFDAASEEKIATVHASFFLRGDGGSGSFGTPPPELAPAPESGWDRSCILPTLAQSALIYRLSGDFNPLHADPDAAEKAGFSRPILHGLCTLGVAVRAAIDVVAAGAPSRIESIAARFTKPVFPGETIRVEFCGVGAEIRFRASVTERDVVVLDRGTVSLSKGER